MYEKSKNGSSRGFWLLLMGFILGVVVTLGAVSLLGTNNSSAVAEAQPDLALTATVLINEATQMAQITPAADLDPLLMTATAIIQQATQQAGG